MLAKRNRITSADDYRRLVRKGRRSGGAVALVYGARGPAGAPFRMGVIVAKNVGGAVVRNRVRRRIKAVGWAISAEHDGIEVVVRALPTAATADWSVIDADVRAGVAAAARKVSGCAA